MNNKNNLISDKDSYITGKKYRFTVLSPRLIRLEYSENGVFEDRETSRVINRAFPKTKYAITESDTLIQIDTGVFTLTYVKNSELKSGALSSNIKAVINGTDKEWQMNNPEVKNLRSINYSIDSIKDKIVLDKGLYSLDGFFLLDDTDSLVLDQINNYVSRSSGVKDLYLFMYDKDFDGCLEDYFKLTGYPSLIPRYALGAWWYKNDKYSSNEIVDTVNKFNKENIPISIFMLGDHWHDNLNNYTPNIDLKTINSYLNSQGIRLGLTINPSLEIPKESNEYKFISNYININKPNNMPLSDNRIGLYFTMVNENINLDNLKFIPLSNDRIALYFNLIINNLESLGTSIFSIDYNNPLDKNNLWKLNHYHYKRNEARNQRGLILSRNPNFASHRYPVMWSGKTKVNWTTLNLLPRYNLQGYNIGVSFIAHPIGGYSGGIEEDELYLRYIQFACFSPIFLLASEGGKYYKREPWKWNTIIQNHITYYMNLRYKLIPYIYSESYNYHKTGHGIIKPFYYEYPKIIDEPQYQNQYFFGSNMFIAPITTKKNPVINRVMKKIYVPNGIWFDLMKGKKYNGNKTYNNFYRDEDYPVFVKAGSIVPLNNNIKEDIPSTLEVGIYPLDNGEYNLYEDDGYSNNYKRGLYMITNFSYQYEKDNYKFIIRKKDGKNLLNTRNYILRFKNIKNIQEVNINDKLVQYNSYYDKDDFIIQINNLIVGRELEINIKGKDSFISRVTYLNEEIKEILHDLQIETKLKELIDEVLFSDLEIRKKRIKLRKLKNKGLDSKYIKIFINLLEYIEKI